LYLVCIKAWTRTVQCKHTITFYRIKAVLSISICLFLGKNSEKMKGELKKQLLSSCISGIKNKKN
jgi:hypothetical protein